MSDVMPLQHDLGMDESKHALSLLRNLERLKNSMKQCDLIIKVGKEELHVHRNVMMAGSDFFDAMFSHDTQENRSGVVEMKEVTFSILKKCIIYLYTGRFSVIEEECEEVLYVASMLLLTEVCGKVAPFLESRINSSSFFNIKRIASKFDLDNLNKLCDDFALKNFDLIVKEEEFGQLEMEYVSFLIKSRKDSNIGSEDERLELILQWIKADVEEHQQHLVAMMSLLDLGEVSESLISDLVEKEPLCYESAPFMKLLYLVEKRKPRVVPSTPTVDAVQSSQPNSILVFDKSARSLRAYRPRFQSWVTLQDLHRDMLQNVRYTAVVMGQYVYVPMANKKFYRIKIDENDSKWVELRQMKLDHGAYLRATVLGGVIYVAGSACLERYMPEWRSWQIISQCGAPCNLRALVSCNNLIYTIGGRAQGSSRGINSFCPESLCWSTVKPMICARQTCAATVYKGKIFVAGGNCSDNNEDLSSVERYDPSTHDWTLLDPMICSRDEFCICVVDDKLFAVGDLTSFQDIEEYDALTGKWQIVKQLGSTMLETGASVAINLSNKLFE